MAKISQYFKDKAKTIKDYPKTLIKAVYGDDGKRLDNIISDITSDIDSTKAKIGTTDISAIGDGTVTGGLSTLSNNAYDLKMLGWTVPKECPVQNYVDEDGVFHQIVGRVDLSKLMWEWADTLNEFRTDLYIMGMNPYSTNIYCSKYKFGSEMYISGMGIYIKDPNYDSSTISQFKADNKGVYFYYELATEITKPVDGNEAIKLLNDKLGNTDISAIGDGTVTGGLNALNSNLNAKFVWTILSNAQTDAWGNLHIDKLEKYIPISVVAFSEYIGMLYQKSSYEWFIHFMTDNQGHTIASNFTFANVMVLWVRDPNYL